MKIKYIHSISKYVSEPFVFLKQRKLVISADTPHFYIFILGPVLINLWEITLPLSQMRPPRGVCAPLIPENNALISPTPWKKVPKLPENIFPLLPISLKLIQLLPKSPKSQFSLKLIIQKFNFCHNKQEYIRSTFIKVSLKNSNYGNYIPDA